MIVTHSAASHRALIRRQTREVVQMEFEIDPADDAFRLDVRTYIREKMLEQFPERAQRSVPTPYSRDEIRRWISVINQKGLLVPHWPAEYGGSNWRPNWRRI